MLDPILAEKYIAILREELTLATGCTEPIAIAYCAATLQALLPCCPKRVEARLSGNIIKNVKSVVVPNTGGRKGIGCAIAAGMVAGEADKALQVIAALPESASAEIDRFLETVQIEISCADTPCKLDIDLSAYAGDHSARVRITNHHTNIVCMERDGEILLSLPIVDSAEERMTDRSCLNVADIVRFADAVSLEAVAPLLEQQVRYNSAIAEEGLRGNWGAEIGKTILEDYPNDVQQRAKAYAAAGSDARMSGCEMPVVILSGSGNQGITACMPVVVYARQLASTQERLYRALLVSDLITIHQKSGIGRLSAYCGAISAGVGAGAGVCYLLGGDFTAIAHTVVNAVAILSGTICDGAKSSCAAKIAAAVDAGILGYRMYMHRREFHHGEGIVASSVDETIANVGMLAQEGMRQTDATILDIMQSKRCN